MEMEIFFMFIASVILLILYIIMIVKFFAIVKDVRKISKILEKKESESIKEKMNVITTAFDRQVDDADVTSVDLSQISYQEVGDSIVFSTGKQGEVGSNFGVFFITTKKGMQHFNTKEEAINALRRDLHC